MEKAAAKAAEYSGADIIDINMGCPVPKVCNNGEGVSEYSPANHDTVTARPLLNIQSVFGREDIAVGNDRDGKGLLHIRSRLAMWRPWKASTPSPRASNGT